MKELFKKVAVKIFLTVITFFTCAMFVFAQDSGGSSSSTSVTTTRTETQTWYTEPWVWVVGGAVFIIILVALLRGNSREKVTVSKTERIDS